MTAFEGNDRGPALSPSSLPTRPLEIECPRPQKPLKRSFDEDDSAPLPPTKRRHTSATPPTPILQTVPRLSKPACEEGTSARALAPQENRVQAWLAETIAEAPPDRATSCPPRLQGNIKPPATSNPAVDQGPLLEVLQRMSRAQWQGFGRGAAASSRYSRPATSNVDYRTTLWNNGIGFDLTGEKIPLELRNFLDSKILQRRSTNLSPEAITDAVQIAVDIAGQPESNVYDLIHTATLSIKRSDVQRGGNTPWARDGLPRNVDWAYPLATAKPDVHCGYATGQRSTWTARENTIINHAAAKGLTHPAKVNCFPYLVLELKSEAMGGTLWQVENQAAGSGASCVNAARWLFQEANPSQEPSVVDTMALSACVTHRQVVWHVHWYSAEERQHYMSWIATHDTIRQVQECDHLTLNFLDHCKGDRQTKLRGALVALDPIPDHWKQARPASAMDL